MKLSRILSSLAFAFSTVGHSSVDTEIGQGVPVNLSLFGSNSVHETADDPAGSEDYRALVRELNIRAIRYPSGSPASFWDWKTGHFIPDEEINAIWPVGPWNWMTKLVNETRDVEDGVLGPIRFQEFGDAVGTEIQWMLNLTTREYDQLEVLQNLKDHGSEIRFIEMDNETYFWGEEFGEAERGENYAKRVDALSPAIREMFPGVRIGMVTREDDLFTLDTHDDSDAMVNWNSHIMKPEHRPHFDALILHHYVMKRQRLDPYKTDTERGKAFLAYPSSTLERAARLIDERWGDYKMWITEFNVIAYFGQFQGEGESADWMVATRDTGWNAIYQATFMITGMRQPDDIEILNHHSISNLDLGWGLGLPVDRTHGEISKMGQLFSHMSSLAGEYETMHPLDFDGNPVLGVTIEGDSEQGALFGSALRREGAAALFVINRSDQDLTISLNESDSFVNCSVTTYLAIEDGPATMVVDYESDLEIWQQGPMKPVRLEQKGFEGSISIPAFSLSIVELSQ